MPTPTPDDRPPGSLFVYTSGTTGQPKGIRRPIPPGDPDQLANDDAVFGRAFDFRPFDGPMLVSTGMFHGGSHSYYMGGLNVGHALVIMDRFDPEQTLRLIEQYRVRTAYMVPTQFHRLLQLPRRRARPVRPFEPPLRRPLRGAVPAPVKEAMMDWWGPVIWETYGGMEGPATIAKPHRWLEKPGTVGRAISGVRLSILDDDGNELRPGEVGHIYMENGVGFIYHGDPDQTASAFIGASGSASATSATSTTTATCSSPPGQGHDHHRRHQRVPGRDRSGAAARHPDVDDVAVFGVPDPDWGETIVAAVQPAPGVDADDGDGSRAARVLSRAARQLQVPAPLGVPRRPAPHRGRQALQAAAPRRVHRHTGGTIEMTETSKSTHDAFKVDAELEKEFQKALSYTLDDDDIDRARLLLGVDVAPAPRS